jgi:3-hydroxyisobutyrate dehydrogenase-like beta-hydroxyacid dehydrogenase
MGAFRSRKSGTQKRFASIGYRDAVCRSISAFAGMHAADPLDFCPVTTSSRMNSSNGPESTFMSSTTPQAKRIGVIGLGLLGSALCERLLGAGFDVVAWNRSRDKAEPLLALGARWSENPLAECDRAVVCLYTTQIVNEVLDQMKSGLRAGQIIVDTTTGDPEQTVPLAERLAGQGIRYLESPIAASSEQTRQGKAMAIVAGPTAAFETCRDVFAAIAGKTVHVGTAWGAAAKVKLVNNLVLGLNRVALAEGLVFAKAIGLDPAATLDVLKEGNPYSGVMDTKGRKMIDGDFSLQAKLSQHAKDVRIILAEARRGGLSLPVSQLHLQLLAAAEAAGFGEVDNSAIIRAIEIRAAENKGE